MRRIATIALLGLLTAVLPGVGLASSAAADTGEMLALKWQQLGPGEPIRLGGLMLASDGSPVADQAVSLWRVQDGQWVDVATADTDSHGLVGFQDDYFTSTTYQLRADIAGGSEVDSSATGYEATPDSPHTLPGVPFAFRQSAGCTACESPGWHPWAVSRSLVTT